MCTNTHLVEEYPREDDNLVYAYHEGGWFWTGPRFGCVHLPHGRRTLPRRQSPPFCLHLFTQGSSHMNQAQASQDNALATTPKTDTPALYRVTSLPADRIGALVKENLGGTQLNVTDLQQFGGTTGGATEWEVATGTGTQTVKEVKGILIWHTTDPRAYYAGPYDPSQVTPPDCTSWDGVTGVGTPGGDCKTCEMNVFGSARDGKGKGKACREKHLLFLLREKDLIPCVISPPTTSLGAVQNFFLDLVNEHSCFYYEVECRFWLVAGMKNGYKTAFLHGEVVRMLTEAEVGKIAAYREAIIPVLQHAAPATEPF